MASQGLRHGRRKRVLFVRTLLVTSNETIGLGIDARQKRVFCCRLSRLGIIDSGNSILCCICLAGGGIQPNIVGFEKCPELVILLLSDRVILVVVTASALQRDPQKTC